LLNELKDQYSKYWVSNLMEVNNNSGTKYYITVENAETKLVLYTTGSGGWAVFNKSKKV